ncbi:MAG: hypothetical protein V1492_04515 [Candidatus Micrarchaeota archaeon]
MKFVKYSSKAMPSAENSETEWKGWDKFKGFVERVPRAVKLALVVPAAVLTFSYSSYAAEDTKPAAPAADVKKDAAEAKGPVGVYATEATDIVIPNVTIEPPLVPLIPKSETKEPVKEAKEPAKTVDKNEPAKADEKKPEAAVEKAPEKAKEEPKKEEPKKEEPKKEEPKKEVKDDSKKDDKKDVKEDKKEEKKEPAKEAKEEKKEEKKEEPKKEVKDDKKEEKKDDSKKEDKKEAKEDKKEEKKDESKDKKDEKSIDELAEELFDVLLLEAEGPTMPKPGSFGNKLDSLSPGDITAYENMFKDQPLQYVTAPSAPDYTADDFKETPDSSTTRSGLEPTYKYGASILSNEVGGSVMANLQYRDWVQGSGGVLWINSAPAPLANLNIMPHVHLADHHVSLGMLNNFAFAYNMTSWFYTAHGVYASAGYKKNGVGFKVATLLQAAVSVPVFDDMYAKWVNGATIDLKKWQLYAIQTSYFAASTTPLSSLAIDYKPRPQSVETGISVEPKRGSIVTVGGVIDKFDSSVFGRYTHNFFGKEIDAQTYLQTGVHGIATDFFPLNFEVLAGVQVGFGGYTTSSSGGRECKTKYEYVIDMQYSNQNLGVTPEVSTTRISNYDAPNDQTREMVEHAKATLISSGSFNDLVVAYRGASKESILAAANYMGSMLAEAGYATGAYDDLRNFNIFSPTVQRVSQQNYESIFNFLSDATKYYTEHGNSFDGLPEDMKSGIAICSGIHEYMAEFLRANGITAYTATVNTKKAAHVVTLAFYDGKAAILDYGLDAMIDPGSFDGLLNAYAKLSGAPIYQTQIFGRGGKYLGTYETVAGKLLHGTRKMDARDVVSDEIDLKINLK